MNVPTILRLIFRRLAFAIQTCAFGTSAAKGFEFFAKTLTGAVQDNAGMVRAKAEGLRRRLHRFAFEVDEPN